jgi:hypothetical protein
MLGITLPVMLLTVFPLASIFLENIFSPAILFILFDILIPFIAFIQLTIQFPQKLLMFFQMMIYICFII